MSADDTNSTDDNTVVRRVIKKHGITIVQNAKKVTEIHGPVDATGAHFGPVYKRDDKDEPTGGAR